MNCLRLSIAVAITVCLGACDAVVDQPRTFTASGLVLDAESRAPLVDVPVELEYVVPLLGEQSGVVATGITDAEGRFRVSGRSWVRDLSLRVNVDNERADALPGYGSRQIEVVHGWDEAVLLDRHP